MLAVRRVWPAVCPLCSVCHDYKRSLERSLWLSQVSRGPGYSHGSWLVPAGASDHIHHRPSLFSLQGSTRGTSEPVPQARNHFCDFWRASEPVALSQRVGLTPQ